MRDFFLFARHCSACKRLFYRLHLSWLDSWFTGKYNKLSYCDFVRIYVVCASIITILNKFLKSKCSKVYFILLVCINEFFAKLYLTLLQYSHIFIVKYTKLNVLTLV